MFYHYFIWAIIYLAMLVGTMTVAAVIYSIIYNK